MSEHNGGPLALDDSTSVGVIRGVHETRHRAKPHSRRRWPDAKPGIGPDTSVETVDAPIVLLPPREQQAPAGHRHCPTLAGDALPLVRQAIDVTTCASRQCESYHKCGNCLHRDRPLFDGSELPPLENGPSHEPGTTGAG